MSPEDIYLLHRDKVFHLCLRFCGGNVALAEDITQDVFVKLIEQLTHLSDLDGLEPWLYRVATNTCYTRFKRETSIWEKVRQTLMLSPSITQDTPEKQVVVRKELEHTFQTLQQLPPKERIVFCMHYLDEMPQQRIATILSLSKGYVSKLLQRAKQHIIKQGWGDSDV